MFGCFRELGLPLPVAVKVKVSTLLCPCCPSSTAYDAAFSLFIVTASSLTQNANEVQKCCQGIPKKTKMCSRAVFRCFGWMERMGDKVTGAAGPVFVTLAIVLISSGVFCFCESSKVVIEVSNGAD